MVHIFQKVWWQIKSLYTLEGAILAICTPCRPFRPKITDLLEILPWRFLRHLLRFFFIDQCACRAYLALIFPIWWTKLANFLGFFVLLAFLLEYFGNQPKRCCICFCYHTVFLNLQKQSNFTFIGYILGYLVPQCWIFSFLFWFQDLRIFVPNRRFKNLQASIQVLFW